MEPADAAEALRGLAARRDKAIEDVKAAAIHAVRAGTLSEVRVAEEAGVSRPTLRKWLGK